MEDKILDRYVWLTLGKKPTEDELAFIESMHDIVKKCGCAIKVYDSSSMKSLPKDERLLCLGINTERVRNSRNAGRKKIYPMGIVKVGDVKKMMETKSASEVAAELGISRATLFRRLKGKDDNRYL